MVELVITAAKMVNINFFFPSLSSPLKKELMNVNFGTVSVYFASMTGTGEIARGILHLPRKPPTL